MHIIDHTRRDTSGRRNRKTKRKFRVFIMVCVLILLSYSAIMTYRFSMPVAAIKPVAKNIDLPVDKVQMSWPAYGQAAVGEKMSGLLAGSPNQTPRPTASVAKVMTALAILRKKPLKIGESGPTITLTNADVDLYNQYLSKDGSVVKVTAGQKITQYQALQAVLIPSANNMADSLSRWAFGSERQYNEYANSLALSLGMKQSTIADASGFSPQTVSTANDLVLLANAALQEPVLAEIVGQSSAVIPVHGEIKNVNWLLGTKGVNGIKTGNTEEAGGCFMVSVERTLADGQKKTLIAVVLGAPSRNIAMNATLPILDAIERDYVPVKVITKNQKLGYYSVSWHQVVHAVAKDDVVVYHWRGTPLKHRLELIDAKVSSKKGAKVGSISIKGQKQQSDVILDGIIPDPPNSWRLQRAFAL